MIAKELLGELGGVLAEEAFGTASAGDLGYRLTKKWLSQKEREQVNNNRTSIEYQVKQVLDQALHLLSDVSVYSPSLKPSGNSQQLIRRLKRIAGFTRLETKITRAIEFLQSLHREELVHNKDIPALLFKKKPKDHEAYGLLRRVENALRLLIQQRLSSISENWWVERIPEDVRERAEDRKKRNEQVWPWNEPGDLHPIHYVDFADYVKVIRRRDNWQGVFSAVFRDPELLSVKLRELEPVRNAVAHFRPLSRKSFERLELNATDILEITGH